MRERGGECEGDGRGNKRRKARERGAVKKLLEVEREEGGREDNGNGDGMSWWELMVEEEGEGWKEVRKKREEDRGKREGRRR